MRQYTTSSAQETIEIGKLVASTLKGGEVIAFTGGLGMGKTTFCNGLAQGLGVVDMVSSPTFAIVNYYRGKVPFAHFDAYRISTPEDLETAGFYDYLDRGAVIAIEWSENIAQYLPLPYIKVNFSFIDENTRTITIEEVV